MFKTTYYACSRCGAIVKITSTQDGETQDVLDNAQQHADWHARLREKLEMASSPIGFMGNMEGI